LKVGSSQASIATYRIALPVPAHQDSRIRLKQKSQLPEFTLKLQPELIHGSQQARMHALVLGLANLAAPSILQDRKHSQYHSQRDNY
jgi:hypothetical protein